MSVFKIPFQEVLWHPQEAQNVLGLLNRLTYRHKQSFEKSAQKLQLLKVSSDSSACFLSEKKCDEAISSWKKKVRALGLRPFGLWGALFHLKDSHKNIQYAFWGYGQSKLSFLSDKELKTFSPSRSQSS